MPNTFITIKSETEKDFGDIYFILAQAFKQNNEAELVKHLRKTEIFDPRLSLLAFKDSSAVGYILFYPLIIKTSTSSIKTLGLVPLAINPQFQNKGIGSMLVKEGLKRAKELGYQSVFVVGDPKYYERFRFSLVKNIDNNIGIPQDHLMATELVPESLKNIKGTLIYPPEFNGL